MIGDDDPVIQHRGQHLAPTRRRFGILIGDRRIPGQENRRGGDWFNADRLDRWLAKELQRQLVVPGEFLRVTRVNPHPVSARCRGRRLRQSGRADIHQETTLDFLAFAGAYRAQHQAARLGLDRRIARPRPVPQSQGHAITAFGQRDGIGKTLRIATRFDAVARRLIGLQRVAVKDDGLPSGSGRQHQEERSAGWHDMSLCRVARAGERHEGRHAPPRISARAEANIDPAK